MTVHATASSARRAPGGLPDRIQHLIDGRSVDSADGATFDVFDPVTNQAYLTAAAGSAADIDAAVAAALRAFTDGPWPLMVARERATILTGIADAVAAQNQRLAEIESFDTGLPITQAQIRSGLSNAAP